MIYDAAVQISATVAVAAAGTRIRISVFEYSGTFADAAEITIDMDLETCKVGSTHTYTGVDGFWDLYPGDNDIIYEDSEGARSVAVRIEHKDKHG